LRQADRLEQSRDPQLTLGMTLSEKPTEEIDILVNRHRPIKILAEALRHIGDTRLDMLALDAVAEIGAKRRDPSFLDALHAGNDRATSICRRRQGRSGPWCCFREH